jgi:hypothetical protein
MHEEVTRLLLFNEQVSDLEARDFTKYLRERGGTSAGISWSAADGVLRVQREAPSDESIRAFVLTLRILIQPRDRISFEQLGELYCSLPVSAETRERFLDQVAAVKELLATDSGLREGGTNLTREGLMDHFLYGRLAHVNPDKNPRYRAWAQRPELHAFLEQQFIETLAFLLVALLAMRRLNEAALTELAMLAPKLDRKEET